MTAAPTRADVERYTAGGIHATIECGRDDDQPTDFVDATDYDALLSREAQLREALLAVLASADHTLPASWRRDRPVSLARAAAGLKP